jgi:hypothetical protein
LSTAGRPDCDMLHPRAALAYALARSMAIYSPLDLAA